MDLKDKFPFRLSAPSYIVPGDIATNVAYLSRKVDDIELIIFESDEICPLPDVETIASLRQIALDNDLTFTIHLPLDIWLGDPNEAERNKSVGKCLRVVERMRPLVPLGFVLHCNRKLKDSSTQVDDTCWQKNVEKSIGELLLSGIPSNMICIETLDYPFTLIEPILHEKELGVCLDIGHILFNDFPLDDYLHRYSDETRIIHLHGVKEGKDHCALSSIERKYLSLLFKRLSEIDRHETVVTVEVFDSLAFETSLSVMEEFKP